MHRQGTCIIFIFAFLNFHWMVRGANRFLPTDPFPELFNDEVKTESLFNSLSVVKDNRTILTTILDSSFLPDKDVTINLFTKGNPNIPYVLKINDTDNLEASLFNPERITKIIIHGWTDNANSNWVKDMRRNYLIAGNFNVITVDWYTASVKEYFVSARLTRQVGEYLGDFLEYLRTEGNLSYSDVHILGHSLGAHVAGFAGAATSSTIGRITGLDPARPAFETPVVKGQKDRLDPSDAQFVDVIHTCAGTAGFVRALGHVDFYPNGGSFIQPGCSVIISQYCSHGRSHQFMTESIIGSPEFFATRCDSYGDYKAGKCKDNSISVMGETVSSSTRGKFYLETNAEPPFARGMQMPEEQTPEPTD